MTSEYKLFYRKKKEEEEENYLYYIWQTASNRVLTRIDFSGSIHMHIDKKIKLLSQLLIFFPDKLVFHPSIISTCVQKGRGSKMVSKLLERADVESLSRGAMTNLTLHRWKGS